MGAASDQPLSGVTDVQAWVTTSLLALRSRRRRAFAICSTRLACRSVFGTPAAELISLPDRQAGRDAPGKTPHCLPLSLRAEVPLL
jgi:hypothetical protein